MVAIPVVEPSQIAQARRSVASLGQSGGVSAKDIDRAALIVTELGTNLLKHGGGGTMLMNASDRGFELIALDRGVGMANPEACIADGYSTAGTLGNGLGAVRRASDELSIASWPGMGTAVLVRIRPPQFKANASTTNADIGSVVVAMPGEEACGDAWSLRDDGGSRTIFVVDGLGHGPEAARAAHEAVLQFQRTGAAPVATIIDDVHRALQPTRGGAVAAARIDRASSVMSFAGLGNIAAAIVGMDGKVRRMVSHNGTAGHNARKIQAFDYPGARGLLVMHSDGIDTRWTLSRYPAVQTLDPLLIASLLYRDHARGRDDATVVVARL
jgi:anti-sigma regulatory factor (Ser/Thr protein kinase)